MKNRPQGQKSQDQLYDLAMQFPSEKIPNYMYQNDGQLHLKEVTKNWGLSQPGYSFGAAYADLDLDGDLELIVCNSNEAVHLFENKNPGNNNFLQVAIKGNRINPRGLGTKVIVYLGDQKLYQELTYTRGYQSSSSEVLHFGLGSANIVDSIAVIFPDKKVYKNQNIKANQQLKVDHHLANHPYRPLAGTPPIFGESTKANHLNFQHLENNFDDFAREILLPHRQSRNGPFISSGDVNQDGFTDFFIGNASGQAGQLFLQKANGQFENAPPRAWKKEAPSEDMGSLFFDADGDEDLDLYVASGGSQFAQNSPLYQDRLYLNNGQGVFQKNPKALPKLYSNSSCVRSADFDRDGDLDLFIGGRGLAGKYPHPGRSQLLVNNKGNFKEQSKALAPELSNIGMVTDAVWADYNQDGWTDLIVVGEWMQPTFFKNNEGQLSQDAQALAAALRGWWFHIEASDLDSDGDLDFVVGNMGTNHKYKASDQKPLLVYSNDFDQNNTNDIVLAKNSDYGVVPVRGRECSSEQMPFIANKFKTYQSFANASLDDIYGEELQQSLSYEATDFRSGWLENKKGRFTFHAFPNLAQIAPIMGTVIKDFNDDGQVDVLVAGNHFDAEVETVRHDAGNGLLLLGQTDQTFVPKTFIESGFYAPLNVKDLAFLPSAQKDRALVIVANNNQTLRCFTFKNKTSTTNKPSQ
ncbi:MAG: FG-GAP-like repeat-containing protein [Bacteroidota bacterium]